MMILLIILFLLSSSPLYAGDFHLEATSLGQVRDNENAEREIPLNGYLGLGVSDVGKWHFSNETNMRLFHDFDRDFDDYDLYQAVLHIQPLQALSIDFGRQFVNEGFSAEIIDGLHLSLLPIDAIEIVAYSGIPRSVERGDFNENDGLLTGLSMALRNIPSTNARLHVAWRNNSIRSTDIRENDSIRVGADLSHQWGSPISPRLYGLAEFDATAKILDTGTAGIDLTPAPWVSLGFEFDYFNINRETTRPTILSLFTEGETLSGRFSSTWTLVPDLLDLVESYSFQRIEVQEGLRRNGHLLEAGLPFSFDSIGLFVMPAYYFADNFGGRYHGVRGMIREEFTEKISAEVGLDYTNYRKVTNDNDFAFSSVVWTEYEFLKGLALAMGFEYNKNNLFNRDIRGSMKLSYHYGHSL